MNPTLSTPIYNRKQSCKYPPRNELHRNVPHEKRRKNKVTDQVAMELSRFVCKQRNRKRQKGDRHGSRCHYHDVREYVGSRYRQQSRSAVKNGSLQIQYNISSEMV